MSSTTESVGSRAPQTSFQQQFLLIEYEKLRELILERIRIIENDMRYGIVVSGALWAWILTHRAEGIPNLLLLVPLVVVVVLAGKFFVQNHAIGSIVAYIRSLEHRLPELLGAERTEWLYGRDAMLRTHVLIYWCSVIAANAFAALYFW